MEATQILLTVVLSLSALLCVKWLVRFALYYRTFPPGPWGLPLVGYAPWIGKKPYETFTQLAKKYGSIFSVTLGSKTMVVLNDWTAIQETLVKLPKEFSGRPFMFVFKAFAKGKNIGSLNGPVWKAQRNLVYKILKNIGMNRKSMEGKVMDIVHEMFNKLNKMDGRTLPVEPFFFEHILKVNWKLVAGVNYNKLMDLNDIERTIFLSFKSLQRISRLNIFPWLRFLPPDGFGFWSALRVNKLLLSYFRNVIDQHVTNYKEDELTDFIDFYLSEIKKKKLKNQKPKAPYNIEHLLMTIWSLYPASVDTTETTILWGFLFLASHPHVQKRAQEEMDRVVGRRRLPTMDDMVHLPYVEALVMEIHRKSSVVHMSVPHETMSTVHVLGRTIPKGTTCLQNIYAVHHDPNLWDEPEAFKPERFIDENNVAKAPPYFMPFSIGPRVCLGVTLAEMELKLILSCLLHRFTFTFPPHQPTPTFEPDVNVTLRPLPYCLHVHKRML